MGDNYYLNVFYRLLPVPGTCFHVAGSVPVLTVKERQEGNESIAAYVNHLNTYQNTLSITVYVAFTENITVLFVFRCNDILTHGMYGNGNSNLIRIILLFDESCRCLSKFWYQQVIFILKSYRGIWS